MGVSRYVCRPRARSVAVQPRQALDMIDGEATQSFSQQRTKRETVGSSYYGSFTYAQSPFAPVPEVLHNKAESAAQEQVYKEFFHVWRGHSQSVCAAGSGSSGTAAVLKNRGAPQAYMPILAPVSGALLTSQAAPLTFTQPTGLVFKELIPGAPDLSSDPPEIQTGDSSGSLGENIGAASTSPPVISSVLSVVSSPVKSFPATISVDNRVTVLPDALNTGDGEVSQKFSANPSAVGGCSCRSASMGMLKYSTRLQPRHFRPSTVRRTTSKALEMQVNKLFEEVFQSDTVERIKGHLDSILQSFRNSEDLILIEQKAVIGLEQKQKRNSYCRCKPISFIKEYGPKIQLLEETCKRNHKALNYFETGLFLYCKNNDPLSLIVSDLHKRNNTTSKEVAGYAKIFDDYCCRFDIETSWISQMAKRLEGNLEMFTFAASEVRDLENNILELIDIVDDLIVHVKESPNDFETQIAALRTLILISESAGHYAKICSWVDEYVTCMCRVCENARILLEQKIRYSSRFSFNETIIAREIPKMKRLVDNLRRDVDFTRISYDEKKRRLKDVQVPDTKIYTYKKVEEGNCDFSMRDRKWGGRNVCPAIRTQGSGKCSYVATVSCTESRYKRMSADDITVGSHGHHRDEFIIKLSPDHLEDMVEQFYEKNSQRKPSEKLDVALERLEVEGVASEEAYNDANFDLQDYHRYRINGFKKLNTARIDVANAELEDGKALIGNFKITTDYHRLGGNDIYEIPEDAVFETTPAGQVSSHCVVIVGFGKTPGGLPYYIFQNSYGPAWGLDGYGRVACSSLKRMYSPEVHSVGRRVGS